MVKRNELLTPLDKIGNGVGYSLASNSSDLSTHIHGRDQRECLGNKQVPFTLFRSFSKTGRELKSRKLSLD